MKNALKVPRNASQSRRTKKSQRLSKGGPPEPRVSLGLADSAKAAEPAPGAWVSRGRDRRRRRWRVAARRSSSGDEFFREASSLHGLPDPVGFAGNGGRQGHPLSSYRRGGGGSLQPAIAGSSGNHLPRGRCQSLRLSSLFKPQVVSSVVVAGKMVRWWI